MTIEDIQKAHGHVMSAMKILSLDDASMRVEFGGARTIIGTAKGIASETLAAELAPEGFEHMQYDQGGNGHCLFNCLAAGINHIYGSGTVTMEKIRNKAAEKYSLNMKNKIAVSHENLSFDLFNADATSQLAGRLKASKELHMRAVDIIAKSLSENSWGTLNHLIHGFLDAYENVGVIIGFMSKIRLDTLNVFGKNRRFYIGLIAVDHKRDGITAGTTSSDHFRNLAFRKKDRDFIYAFDARRASDQLPSKIVKELSGQELI